MARSGGSGLPSRKLRADCNLSVLNVILALGVKTSAHDRRNHDTFGTVGNDATGIRVGDRVVARIDKRVRTSRKVKGGTAEEGLRATEELLCESRGDIELAVLDIRVCFRVGGYLELVVSETSEIDFMSPDVAVKRLKVVLEDETIVWNFGKGTPGEEDGQGGTTQTEEEEKGPSDEIRDADVRVLFLEPGFVDVGFPVSVADEGGRFEGSSLYWLLTMSVIDRRRGLADRRSSKCRISGSHAADTGGTHKRCWGWVSCSRRKSQHIAIGLTSTEMGVGRPRATHWIGSG